MGIFFVVVLETKKLFLNLLVSIHLLNIRKQPLRAALKKGILKV